MKSLVFRCLALLGTVAALLLVLEGLLRIVDSNGDRPANHPSPELSQYAKRFREDLPVGKAAGEFRVLALGDSFTWGYGLGDGRDAWPKALEARLRGEKGGDGVRVFNLGVPGFTTVNELELLSRKGLALEPDLVVVQFLINDVLPSSTDYQRVGEDWLYERKAVDLLPAGEMHDILRKKSRLYVFVNGRFRALQRKIWPARDWEELYDDGFPGWRDCRKALAGISRLTEHAGGKAVLAIFPSLIKGEWTEESYPYTRVYARVEAAARDSGLAVVNLLPAFVADGRRFEDLRVHFSDGHPGEEAHALAAAAVADFLVREKLVPGIGGE